MMVTSRPEASDRHQRTKRVKAQQGLTTRRKLTEAAIVDALVVTNAAGASLSRWRVAARGV
jgi:hypothetical protein